MSLRWEDIKSFNNSQNNAVEELVCQLAREEDIEGKKNSIVLLRLTEG